MGRTLQPEDILGHYKVIGPLGAGGMGEVYLAHDLQLERDVALKVLPAELVRSEDRVRRFIMEAKSASSLSHPHIVTIHEI
jgi:serine/threonine-protein kinase